MRIMTGLFDHGVLQRGGRGRSDAPVTGATETATGDLLVTVTRGGGAIAGWKDRRAARVHQGKFAFRLAGLPAGGPYRVELAVGDERCVVKDVLVGDVWLCGGQSNMQGCARRDRAAKPHPLVRGFYMDDLWGVARDPLHNLWDCVDEVHVALSGGIRPAVNTLSGVGPAVAFAQEMLRRTGVPQGLLACAHGGTSMTQWDPSRKREGGKSLYGAMVRKLAKNGGRVAGMIWYQGESDANASAAPLYTARMRKLLASVRRDAGDARLPVVLVQLGRVIGWGDAAGLQWNSIQEQQRLLAQDAPDLAVVPAVDLSLDDPIHIGADINRLGRRLAQAMHALAGGKGGGPLPLQVDSVRMETNPVNSQVDVVVRYRDVAGSLGAQGGRPAGFSLMNGSEVRDIIYAVTLSGAEVRIRSSLAASGMESMQLYYGRGCDPICNITDELDRAAPVFGPVPVGKPRALTPFVRQVRISAPILTGDTRPALVPPAPAAGIAWETRTFAGAFCDRHGELAALAPRHGLVYYACTLDVPEPMRLAALLGYDGPVRLWIDDQERFADPDGNNPAIIDTARVAFDATTGRHEVVVALDINQGRAWGIFLRFERLNVARQRLRKGPAAYRMPVVVEC